MPCTYYECMPSGGAASTRCPAEKGPLHDYAG